MPATDEQLAHARPFVEALLDLAEQAGQADSVGSDLAGLAELLAAKNGLAELLGNPLVLAGQKAESLARIFAGRVEDLTLSLLRVLADRDALSLVGVLGQAYRQVRDERAGLVKVQAVTAVPLDDNGRDRLVQRLSDFVGRQVQLVEQVDPELIGGLLLRVGDTVYDGSVRKRLGLLRRQVIARGYHEIQGGRNLLAD